MHLSELWVQAAGGDVEQGARHECRLRFAASASVSLSFGFEPMIATTDPDDQVRRVFRKHVAEVASGTVELVSIARILGDQVLVAVRSRDDTVHPVAVCSYHLRNIVRELGEKVRTVLWSDKPETFIVHALQPFGPSPSPIPRVTLDADSHVAEVAVSRETLTYFAEHAGSRARLASNLVGWDIRLVSHD